MKGFSIFWVLGCDYVGIVIQFVVEKMLYKREKKMCYDFGCEEFIKCVWEWKGEYYECINNVQRFMGGFMDWSCEVFIMDENLIVVVMEVFVIFYDEGFIYRFNCLVNWFIYFCIVFSILEVINKDIIGCIMIDVFGYDRKVEFGVFIYFKYLIEGLDEFIIVVIICFEIMLGDSGIVVSFGDVCYVYFVGKYVCYFFIWRLMFIVEDFYVDLEFGIGVVKFIFVYDFNDYKFGVVYKFEFINVFIEDGLINENGVMFQGQKRFNVCYMVVEELVKFGLFVKKEFNVMVIFICECSGDVIEFCMVFQWWVKMEDMVRDVMRVVESGEIKISLESVCKSYF